MHVAQMTISAPRQYTDHGATVTAATIVADCRRFELFVRASQGPLAAGPDPFLCLGMLPAMKLGQGIHIDAPVADHLLRHVDRIQDIACAWFKDCRRVAIEAAARVISQIDDRRGVGCFFSGGVDSFYSVLTRRNEITHLVFGHGLDMHLSNTVLRTKAARSIRRAAAELGKPLIEVETNARDLVDVYTDWAGESDGAVMACLAHALSPQLKMVYMSGGRTYKRMGTNGASPLLLQLWSTPEIEIPVAGREVNRYQMIVYLAQHDVALRWLRVCWEHRTDDYNCGRCPKCLNTMINLRLASALERCRTFAVPLDLDLVRTTPFGPADRRNYEDTLAAAEQIGTDAAIIGALRDCLGPFEATPGDARFRDDLLMAQRRVHNLERKLQRLRSSHSWQMTAPLRAAGQQLRTVRERLRREE